MDAQIKEALTRAREVLRGLSFKDVAITSALEAIARTLDTERAPNGQAPAQPAPAAQVAAKETARLDYLQEHGATVDLVTSGSRFYPLRFRIGGMQSTANSDLRTAIDAAIAASKKEPT